MKKIDQMDSTALAKIKLLVFDVDGVLVPRGTKISQEGGMTTFETKKIPEHEIEQMKNLHSRGFMLNISSGRSLFMLQDMFRSVLPYVSLTYENGSATWHQGKIIQHTNSYRFLSSLYPELKAISHYNIKGFEPKEFIITIHCIDRVEQIEETVSRYPELYCIWNGEAYDIGVRDIQTKGVGLKMLTQKLDIKKENVLAIGDNYNDVELLSNAGIAVSADNTRLEGHFYVPLDKGVLPAEALMEQILVVKSNENRNGRGKSRDNEKDVLIQKTGNNAAQERARYAMPTIGGV